MLNAVKEVFERFVFDPSLIDLVLWFPHLSWHDLAVSTATVIGWRILSERLERFMSFHIRCLCARGLVRLAAVVEPAGAISSKVRPPRQGGPRSIARFMSRRWADAR